MKFLKQHIELLIHFIKLRVRDIEILERIFVFPKPSLLMLLLRVKPIFKARGIRNPYAWLVENGMPEAAARKMAADAYRNMPLDNLERLCLLLRCTPNDVLRWNPAPGTDLTEQPLAAMQTTEETGLEWLGDISNLSVDALRALGEKVKAAQRGENP